MICVLVYLRQISGAFIYASKRVGPSLIFLLGDRQILSYQELPEGMMPHTPLINSKRRSNEILQTHAPTTVGPPYSNFIRRPNHIHQRIRHHPRVVYYRSNVPPRARLVSRPSTRSLQRGSRDLFRKLPFAEALRGAQGIY